MRPVGVVFLQVILPFWIVGAVTFSLAGWYGVTHPHETEAIAAVWLAALVWPCVVLTLLGWRLTLIDPPERYR